MADSDGLVPALMIRGTVRGEPLPRPRAGVDEGVLPEPVQRSETRGEQDAHQKGAYNSSGSGNGNNPWGAVRPGRWAEDPGEWLSWVAQLERQGLDRRLPRRETIRHTLRLIQEGGYWYRP